MNYKEQLDSKYWKIKREEIIDRDKSCCQLCGSGRSKFRNLSQSFRLKTKNELMENGFEIEIQNDKIVSIIKSGEKVDFQEYTSGAAVEEELIFAQQWVVSKNPFSFGHFRLIIFNEKLSDADVLDLNVHHKFYIDGRNAWEYEDDALITLCPSCHQKVHDSQKIPIYDEYGDLLSYAANCQRCEGSGYLKEFSYFQNGVCFSCMGTGSRF